VRRLVPIAAAVLLALLCVVQGARVGSAALRAPADEAADALPVYLATVTLAEGGDPGAREDLQASYEARALRARAATYSTLYPATLPALLRPGAGLAWPDFVALWRGLLLASLLGCGLLAGLLLPGAGRSRWIAAPAGLLALLLIPASSECVRLGQANMLLALLMAGAMAAVAGRRSTAAGLLLGLGAAVKLVPGLLLLPLLAARRWWAGLAAALVGLLAIGLASLWLAPLEILDGVLQTVRFQAAIHPDWAARHVRPPDWLAFLASFHGNPLLLLTVAVGLPAVVLRPSRGVLLAVMAMLCAWLGSSAAAFHVLYLPLLYPALLHLLVWPLGDRAELRWSAPVAGGAALATALAFLLEPQGLALEARASLLGLGLWALCCVRLERAWRLAPSFTDTRIPARVIAWYPAALALLVGVLLARALPAQQPLAPPVPPALQEKIEVGFIRPGDPAPGPVDAGHDGSPSTVDHRRIGRWPGVVVGSTVRPGSHGALERHISASAATWAELEGDPGLGPWADWVREAYPGVPLREQLAADTLRALVREGQALEAHPDDPRLDALRSSHQRLLAGEPVSARERRSLGAD